MKPLNGYLDHSINSAQRIFGQNVEKDELMLPFDVTTLFPSVDLKWAKEIQNSSKNDTRTIYRKRQLFAN